MRHIFEPGWHLPDMDESQMYQIHMMPHVFNYIKINELEPVEISFSEISHKPMVDEQRKTPRYARADISYPGIVVDGMHNPHGRRYRMIDGGHRLDKQIKDNKTSGMFYVLNPEDVLKYIEPCSIFQV